LLQMTQQTVLCCYRWHSTQCCVVTDDTADNVVLLQMTPQTVLCSYRWHNSQCCVVYRQQTVMCCYRWHNSQCCVVTDDTADSGKSSNLGVLIGVSVSSLIIIILVAIGAVYWWRRHTHRQNYEQSCKRYNARLEFSHGHCPLAEYFCSDTYAIK